MIINIIVDIILINNGLLRDIDHRRVKNFKVYRVQVNPQSSAQEFKDKILCVMNSPYASDYLDFGFGETVGEIDPENVLLWHLEPEENVKEFYKYVELSCKKSAIAYLHSREKFSRGPAR
mgnify:CR=1 FL=1